MLFKLNSSELTLTVFDGEGEGRLFQENSSDNIAERTEMNTEGLECQEGSGRR